MDPLTDGSRTELADAKIPDLPFHPLAELFPLPSEEELRAMADDMRNCRRINGADVS
jgi:hypothetical protein